MKKHFILNLLLNLGIVFLVMSGFSAYQSGNMLIVGLAIAISVVLIYLKIVLLKYVKQNMVTKQQKAVEDQSIAAKKKK